MDGWILFSPWDSPLILGVPAHGGEARVVWNGADYGGRKNLAAVLGVRQNLLILGLQDRLIALDGRAGWSLKWMELGAEVTGGKGFRGTPVGNAAFTGDSAVFSTTKGIYVLDVRTGRVREDREARYHFGWTGSGPVRLAIMGERLYACSEDRLRVFDLK
ncbi:MAG: hypothetical protein ACYTFG_17030 [Planctomycetota bacterium]|jgi:hypothetical protein